MYITVAADKGGVGKTTTAVHLAAYLQTRAATVLIDGDPNRSATEWGAAGGPLPFAIVDVAEGTHTARQFDHVVIDTDAQPDPADLAQLARGCDVLIIPTVPAALDTRALQRTLQTLHGLAAKNYRVLLTKVPPPPETDGQDLRAALVAQRIPLFTAEIPRLKAFDKAASEGVLVHAVTDRRARRAWRAYEVLGTETLAHG